MRLLLGTLKGSFKSIGNKVWEEESDQFMCFKYSFLKFIFPFKTKTSQQSTLTLRDPASS